MRRTSLVELPAALLHASPAGDARWLLGVDGGATKTLAAVLDVDGGTVHLGHGGPSNQDAVGAQAAVGALLEAADAALAAARIGAADLGAAVLAIAGTDTEAIARHVREQRTESWLVVNDVVGAWATATGGHAGVAVISGTGSNVFGVSGEGRAWRAGGWGHVLGDEGSGYWLGVQSIKAALADREGSGPPTALSAAAMEFFAAPSVEAVAARVYAKPLSKGEIAAFAVQTAGAAADGDEVALELYRRGAGELARQVTAVIEHAELAGAFPVGLIGSGFKAGEMFVGPLRDAILARAPQASIAPVLMAPVGGSLVLAARLCGRDGDLRLDELASLLEHAPSD